MKFPNRETLTRWFLTRNTPVFVQIAKYGASGAIGAAILVGTVLALSLSLFPALDSSLIDGEPVSDALRQRNLIINNIIAFPLANLVVYLLNAWLVFTPGRHSRGKEFAIFTLITALSHFTGILAGPFLIERFGITTIVAQLSLVTTSTLVNFLCRKFIVFAR
ncbi:MAG: GtrA family protein [Akkermansiaceae bacterium]|nr:GtrA family protein [Roseibacillus sp.]